VSLAGRGDTQGINIECQKKLRRGVYIGQGDLPQKKTKLLSSVDS